MVKRRVRRRACVCVREREEKRREAGSGIASFEGARIQLCGTLGIRAFPTSVVSSSCELSQRVASKTNWGTTTRALRGGRCLLLCVTVHVGAAASFAEASRLRAFARESACVCAREREREHSIERHTHRSRGVCLGRYWRGWRRLARCRKRRRPRWTCNRLLLLLLLRTNDCARLLLALHRHLFLRLLVERRGVWWRAARPRRRCAWRWA